MRENLRAREAYISQAVSQYNGGFCVDSIFAGSLHNNGTSTRQKKVADVKMKKPGVYICILMSAMRANDVIPRILKQMRDDARQTEAVSGLTGDGPRLCERIDAKSFRTMSRAYENSAIQGVYAIDCQHCFP